VLADERSVGQYVTFRIARQGFALDVTRVRGLLPMHDMVALDVPEGWVLGIAAVRGIDFPVVDVRGKLGIPDGSHGRQPCIVVADVATPHGTQMAGFIADRVCEVITVRQRDIQDGTIRTNGRPRRIFNPDLLYGEIQLSGLAGFAPCAS
jgi:chemotaxis signal transduction protein